MIPNALHRICDDIGVLVHVREAGDPAEQHLGDREASAVCDELGAEPARFGGRDALERARRRQIAREPAEQALRRVRVRIDEARQQNVLRPVVPRRPR